MRKILEFLIERYVKKGMVTGYVSAVERMCDDVDTVYTITIHRK